VSRAEAGYNLENDVHAELPRGSTVAGHESPARDSLPVRQARMASCRLPTELPTVGSSGAGQDALTLVRG